MEVRYDRGILLKHKNEKLLLDPEFSTVPLGIPSVVSHAHSDHTASMTGTGKTYTNQETLELFAVAHIRKKAKNIRIQSFYEPFEIGSFEIEFIKAGHLLGAAQIIVRNGNDTLHFTGDFCPEDLLTVKKADVPKDVDVSIIDTTYGNQNIGFTSRNEVREKLFLWVIQQLTNGKIPILHVAKLGGAQEIIRLLNQLSNNLPIFVTKDIGEICAKYVQLGIDLEYQVLDETEIINQKCIILAPRSRQSFQQFQEKYSKLFPHDNYCRAIITGQSAKFPFSKYDYSAALSTHASFVELIDVIKQINPKQVYTMYGFPEIMAKTLERDHQFPSLDFKKCTGAIIGGKRSDFTNLKTIKNKERSSNYIDRTLDEFW